MSLLKFAFVPTLALIGSLACTAAQAHGADVRWSVTVGAPVTRLPVPVLSFPLPAPVVIAPAPRPLPGVVYSHASPYREPTRWDVDGDGIPNRYDRVYNPAWDRNGDGIPDHRAHRREHRPHPYGDRDHDGIPNRYDRRDDRFDDHPHRGEWRGAR